MNKKKKIIILSISIILILVLASAIYWYFSVSYSNKLIQGTREQIEQMGFNNLSGTVKAIEGDNLRVSARVPENFSLFSTEENRYVEKEFILKILSTSEIYLSMAGVDGIALTQMNSIGEVKLGNTFSAIVKENILKNTELSVKELIINK
ncbi:MAG: hypothetical protein ACYC3G_01290 [Minisyncoccota bacterium]